jgi:hypothetical protein
VTTAITEGVLYFSEEAPHITGYLKVGLHYYEVVGVRRSDIAADVTLRQIDAEKEHGQLGSGPSQG